MKLLISTFSLLIFATTVSQAKAKKFECADSIANISYPIIKGTFKYDDSKGIISNIQSKISIRTYNSTLGVDAGFGKSYSPDIRTFENESKLWLAISSTAYGEYILEINEFNTKPTFHVILSDEEDGRGVVEIKTLFCNVN